MGKVLVVSFGNDEKDVLDEILNILKSKEKFALSSTICNDGALQYDNLRIDPYLRIVESGGKTITLTNYEFEILYLLAKNPGRVFTKEQIYNQVWDSPYYGAEDNVMSLIRRIRKKIEPNPGKPLFILTVWGVGYKFNNHLK